MHVGDSKYDAGDVVILKYEGWTWTKKLRSGEVIDRIVNAAKDDEARPDRDGN